MTYFATIIATIFVVIWSITGAAFFHSTLHNYFRRGIVPEHEARVLLFIGPLSWLYIILVVPFSALYAAMKKYS